MRAFKALRVLSVSASTQPHVPRFNLSVFYRFYSAQPQQADHSSASALPSSSSSKEEDFSSPDVFDSSEYALASDLTGNSETNTSGLPTWDDKYRDEVRRRVFGEDIPQASSSRVFVKEEEKRRRAAALAKSLLEVAIGRSENEGLVQKDGKLVKEEDQKSLSIGIIGAPNAGKSSLTNSMVGTKVAAVSRKMNTTTDEVLGVLTKGNTQICFFDTPGLMLKKNGFPYRDMKVRVQSAWSSVSLYDVLLVIFDVHRHLTNPDSRVVKLIERMGSEVDKNQKRVLCMNKVDLVKKKKDLLKVTEEFKHLHGYDRHFMISGLKGAGVKDLTQYLMEQAVERPWDEIPFVFSEETMKNISMEIVREKLLDNVHQEVPYGIEHRLIDWKELRDGSLRIEQHLITPKISQRKILVGKKGSKIGKIGIDANEELRSIFKRNVHLILMVRVKQ
ncbi:PREDICTED: GTP-binding protein ERG [Ipomoea nil]|uniref:GTP-binding protein ERG n=1 Tax=Ipomoea nil TaxID=35883 RepID=UPI000901A774|nr:PREDICTED: GTP-binding protein ERG [Ipomoea nil]